MRDSGNLPVGVGTFAENLCEYTKRDGAYIAHMEYELGKTIAKRFGITLVCLLAARGCARELREWVQPDAHAQHPVDTYRPSSPDDIARTLERERYAR